VVTLAPLAPPAPGTPAKLALRELAVSQGPALDQYALALHQR